MAVGGWSTFYISKLICKEFNSLISLNESEREIDDIDSVVNAILSEMLISCSDEMRWDNEFRDKYTGPSL